MTVQLDGAPAATDGVLARSLAGTDPAVFAAIADEPTRQQSALEMIASENFAPPAVMHLVLADRHPVYPEPSESMPEDA